MNAQRRQFSRTSLLSHLVPLLALAAVLLAGSFSQAQMVTGSKMADYQQTLGIDPKATNPAYSVLLIETSVPGNILWPNDQPTFVFQITNNTAEPIRGPGRVEVIAYGTKGQPGNIWIPQMFKVADLDPLPIQVDVPAKGVARVKVAPKLPERFGAYALVVDLGPAGRQFGTSCVRTFPARPERLQYPKFSLDHLPHDVLRRLGVQAIRYEISYVPTTHKTYERWMTELDAQLKDLQAQQITVLLMVGAGPASQPLGRWRPHLDDQDVMKSGKTDAAWLPENDDDFQHWIALAAARYGWPKGPVTAFSLWNEPWEGLSISGWGADMLRYRELYRRMALGVEQARREDKVLVLLTGCDSSSNTLDKLFPDGGDEFLKWFDACTIHYQGMESPATYPQWINRKHPNGRVKIWDTESWVANTDDRVATVVATNREAGYDRSMGIFHGNICSTQQGVRVDDGKRERIKAVHAWSISAAIGAMQHFLGEREFHEILFKNGLPWVMVFDGLARTGGRPDPDDGTLVVVGDIGEAFGPTNVLFRTVRSLAEVADKDRTRQELAALPADAPAEKRAALQAELHRYQVPRDATLTLDDAGGRFRLYDFYGNPVPPEGHKIVVPLDHRGCFLRADGSRGSFAQLVAAVAAARIEGFEPLEVVAHDLLAPIPSHPVLRLSLTNILNRPVEGALRVTLGKLTLDAPARLSFQAHETKEVNVRVVGGQAVPDNTYPLSVSFEAGPDGRVVYEENMHVNVIARRTIAVDGRLDDWKDVLPQTIRADDRSGPSLTEAAWFPFVKFDASVTKGVAHAYLAYDDQYFYFAAKIADDTPDEGTVRFETRNDDEYFYPEVSYAINERTGQRETLRWPEGVRRYSYRKWPDLPSADRPRHDNVLVAFNVIPLGEDGRLANPPGTMPRFTGYKCTDYEYALDEVAPKYGGGFEIWRLLVPGMPRKHFYPRQPKSPYDGPVKEGKLRTARDGNTRIVEAALPWSEIPLVRNALDEGRTIKFSFRVNDNAGAGCMELARERSVSKRNAAAFHPDWAEHWANEVEFAFGPR